MNRAALLRASAVGLLVALGVTLIPATIAQADDATWTVRTAANDFGADRTSYSYNVNPGATVDDALVVANRGTTVLDLSVYAADGFTTDSGQFDLLVGGAESVAIGAWVKGGNDHVVVGPGESVEIPFTLTVPENATPGDYLGGILTSLVEPEADAGINVDRRLGIRIALRVGGDLTPGLAVEGMHVDWAGGLNPFAGGDATVSYTIHNTGNAVLSAQQVGTVSGPFGLLAVDGGDLESPPQLLPGETWDVTFTVRNVAPTVLLTASTTITPLLLDASGSTTSLEPVTTLALGLAVPWALLGLIVAAIIVIVLVFRSRRRTAARQRAQEDARVAHAVQSALRARELAAANADQPKG